MMRDDMGRLRGRLFEAIEAAGLPERQEDALKRIIRRETYDAQTSLEEALKTGEHH
jgi:hypothetical protein